MSSSFFDTLTLEQQVRLDRLCDAFEQAWAAGDQPSIARFLDEFPDEHRSTLFLELVQLEVQLRRRRSEHPTLAEYQLRFPDRGEALAALSCFGAAKEPSSPRGDTCDNEVLKTTSLDGPAAHPDESPLATTDTRDWRGSMIGSYRVLDRLGQGGMGEVYRVAHQLIDCQRALKTLRPQLASQPGAVQRFLQEAQVSVRHLTHPNLVTVYDVSRDGDTVYLVMELVEGVDLHELVEREGPLAPTRAAEIVRQAATGLHFAHGQGYVHRDIKPHNIMVTDRGEVKILDLGLVRVLDRPDLERQAARIASCETDDFQHTVNFFRTRLTDDRALIGTLPYMAPEQAADAGEADVLSDIYSLGCTLYYLLTGRHAFSGSSVEDVLRKHLAGDFPPLRQVRPDVPEALERIVLRMLHRDRRERYTSAAQVQAALETWASDRPARVRLNDADELQRGLVHLGLISEDDWKAAVSSARRSARATWRGEAPQTSLSTVQLPSEDAHPAIILQKLQELQNSRGGQKYGLSEFQVRMILNDNADLLRLPQHVLLDQIGAGWKGEIYKARNIASHRTETVRLFPVNSMLGLGRHSAERLPRFEAHVESLCAIEHPHLARVYGGRWFEHRVHGTMAILATEYIVGESLETYIATRQSDPGRWPTLKRLAEQAAAVARALHAAHQAGLLHLDITARSLRIDRDGTLRLTDLGVATLVREMPDSFDRTVCAASPSAAWRATARGRSQAETMRVPPRSPAGTPEVQAPELFRDPRAVSVAADLYSLGCCLFFLLTGSYPFTAEGTSSAMIGHLTRSPWDSPVAARVPTPFKQLLDSLLEKDPHKRCPNAAALVRALDELLRSPTFLGNATVSWSGTSATGSAVDTQTSAATSHGAIANWFQRFRSFFGSHRPS
jgi:serine/threonine protein kinase